MQNAKPTSKHLIPTREEVKRIFGLVVGTLLLSGCVTMPGTSTPQSANESGPAVIKISDVTDLFSIEIRNLKSLVADEKLEEAERHVLQNADYFEKRYASGVAASSDLMTVARYVWETGYRDQVEGYLRQLTPLTTLPPALNWRELNQTLTDTQALAQAIENDRVLRLAELGQKQASELREQQRRILKIASAEKSSILQDMSDPALENGAHSSEYVGTDRIQHSDFHASESFQQAAVARILMGKTRASLASEAERLSDYLSETTKRSVDERYGELVRTDLLADGRITLEEISELKEISAPFKTETAALKNVVKVGYLDLTGASFKDRNIFDFEISFAKDTGFELVPAAEDTFKMEDLSQYDFVFVTDLTAAKVTRKFNKKAGIKSRYKSGARPAPNPKYVTATADYQMAMLELQRAQIESTRQKACQGFGCVLIGIAEGLSISTARKSVDKTAAALSETPQTLSLDVFSEYEFQPVAINSTKAATVNYYVIDVKANVVLQNDFAVQDQESFSVAYNVRDDDPDNSGIYRRFKTEDEVTAWEKRAVRISLSSLFGSDGLKTAVSQPFKGVQNFLTSLSNRTYATAAPEYASAANSPGLASSSRSNDTIADERFDSIVIVRNAQATGTGFYVTPDLILTAHHVVEDGALVELTFYDGTKSYGKVVDHDARLDLALIRAQATGKPLKIHTGPIRLGETVEAIGHPKGYEFTITRGVVSAIRKQRSASLSSDNLVEFVQTDTPISNGNSGGPLMLKNAVIGVNDWIRIDKGSQNLNFSVSFNEIRNYLERFTGR